MSSTGTVTTWRGKYGFVESTDGKTVYVHTDEIDGGSLRIGMTLSFDTEEVEGHSGRVKGTNVSGEAILKKGEKLDDEAAVAERERVREYRNGVAKAKDESLDEVKEAIAPLTKAQKMKLAQWLCSDLGLGNPKETATKAKEAEEKRTDPTDKTGNAQYTKAEFLAFYGKEMGPRIWDLAGEVGAAGKKKKKSKAKKH
eukprot:TRINITY_DN20870_c0_g1_i1.p2 TRINITY_DN20870_c0_g1~~TRINITY_DN20870_c0_g1_i1.p2  ORF type:complete len:198 (+),score=98.27 TRINITY_DN20870_c0_g1_i1:50-643(+)